MVKIAIIDYGMGNLRSVSKAVELCGGDVDIISDADSLKSYNSIILPGVGAFEPAIKILNQKGLDIAIKEHISNKKILAEFEARQGFFVLRFKFGFIGGDLLSLEKESSKETSKKTKIAKRQKPTLYGNIPENE